MKNILTAFAALGALAISSSLFAQAPAPLDGQMIVDGAVQAVESVQADAAIPAPVADHAHDYGGTVIQDAGQPMPQTVYQEGTIQGEQVMMGQPMVHQHQPVHYHYRQPAKKQNVFSKLMELERKKNAWLKKTFLGL